MLLGRLPRWRRCWATRVPHNSPLRSTRHQRQTPRPPPLHLSSLVLRDRLRMHMQAAARVCSRSADSAAAICGARPGGEYCRRDTCASSRANGQHSSDTPSKRPVTATTQAESSRRSRSAASPCTPPCLPHLRQHLGLCQLSAVLLSVRAQAGQAAQRALHQPRRPLRLAAQVGGRGACGRQLGQPRAASACCSTAPAIKPQQHQHCRALGCTLASVQATQRTPE